MLCYGFDAHAERRRVVKMQCRTAHSTWLCGTGPLPLCRAARDSAPPSAAMRTLPVRLVRSAERPAAAGAFCNSWPAPRRRLSSSAPGPRPARPPRQKSATPRARSRRLRSIPAKAVQATCGLMRAQAPAWGHTGAPRQLLVVHLVGPLAAIHAGRGR